MNIRTIISAIIAAFTVLICSVAAFAETIATPADAVIISTTGITIATETDSNSKDAAIIREEVSVDGRGLTENTIMIDTDDISIDEKEDKGSIAVDYADTRTDIPFTGSGKAIGLAVLSACSSIITFLTRQKHRNK